jgi:hypothetical protein
VLDVVVGEVGGLDAAGGSGFGQKPGDAAGEGVDAGGGVSLASPAVPEDGVGGGVGGAPEGPPVAEQVAEAGVDDLMRWSLGAEGAPLKP